MADPTTSSPPPVSAETAATAERMGAPALSLEVVGVANWGGAMRRLTVHDPVLANAEWHPGQDLTCGVPADGRVVRRRYTIRALDRSNATADLDVLLHGGGPGALWAQSVILGDRFEAIGPRGKVWPDLGAAWHLFAGDESYLPATAAMVESLPEGSIAVIALSIGVDLQPPELEAAAECRGPGWVSRSADDDARDGLVAALTAIELPPGDGRAYVGGEGRLVRAVSRVLEGRGMAREVVAAKPYWRADKPNADHGEPPRD